MSPPDWLEKLVAAGPAAIFATLWWLERLDRRDKDTKLAALTERTLVLLTELKGLITGKAR